MRVCLVTQSCLILCKSMNCSPPTVALLCLWDYPDKSTVASCHFLLQIFLTQRWSLHLPWLQHLQVGSLPLSHLGNPAFMIPLSRGHIKSCFMEQFIQTGSVSHCQSFAEWDINFLLTTELHVCGPRAYLKCFMPVSSEHQVRDVQRGQKVK